MGGILILGVPDCIPDGTVDGKLVGEIVIVDVGSLVGVGVGGIVHGTSNVQHGKSYAQSISPLGQGNDCWIGK